MSFEWDIKKLKRYRIINKYPNNKEDSIKMSILQLKTKIQISVTGVSHFTTVFIDFEFSFNCFPFFERVLLYTNVKMNKELFSL